MSQPSSSDRAEAPDSPDEVAPGPARPVSWWVKIPAGIGAGMGLMMAVKGKPAGLALLAFIGLAVTIEREDRLEGDAAPGCRVRLGRLAFLFCGLALLVGFTAPAAITFVVGVALAGVSPLRRFAGFVGRRLNVATAERVVGHLGSAAIGLGVVVLVAVLGGFASVSVGFRDGVVSVGITSGVAECWVRWTMTVGLGLALLAMGLGLRRRQLWSGVIGLCTSFYWFGATIIEVFRVAEGNLARISPAALANLGHLLGGAVFFFGFYSVFFPLISTRARELADRLSAQVKETDEHLRATRERLHEATSSVERTGRDLGRERRKFLALFETSDEGIVILDQHDRIVAANPAWCRLHDFAREQWEGRRWSDLVARPGFEFLPERGARRVDRTPAAGGEAGDHRPTAGIVVMRDAAGEIRRQVAFYTKVVTDAAGAFLAGIGLARDVTLEREIDRVKSEFVSNVSHELRTPLTSIRAYTEMLLDGEAESAAQRREYLEVILGESERLTSLINDILDLSKLEAGRKVMHFATIGVAAMLRRAVAAVRGTAIRQRIELVEANELGDIEVHCEPDLVHQALLNLLGNALKYTPGGGRIGLVVAPAIDPAAGASGGADPLPMAGAAGPSGSPDESGAESLPAPGWYRFLVTDTGPGIAREHQRRIFDKFYRVDDERNREVGGTGLGLALVRHIARVHGGEVTVESELGKGSCFILTLPVTAVPPAPGRADGPGAPTGLPSSAGRASPAEATNPAESAGSGEAPVADESAGRDA